ncbi:MAG: DUF2442 domain-containing protein [Magnetococcales bacterium]|nr:DUF2442 domain-containing protein [Magnetococcales bacterium]
MPTVVNIVAVEQVSAFRLRLHFDDNTEQVVDFHPFLSKSYHPAIRYWLDPVHFSSFRVEYGELVWGDYELCFPMMDLYRNQIEHALPLESVA